MSIVIKCDRCGKEIDSDSNRVIVTATRYTVQDEENNQQQQQPSAVQPSVPGQLMPVPPAQPVTGPTGPVTIAGSNQQFMQQPAFDGQLEMHEECWDKWIDQEEKKTTRKRS